MVTYVRDQTGRFQQRPHYKPEELDRECESVITGFLKGLYGEARYPVDTEDLKKLIERDAEDLDVYADLSIYGPDVEGVTEFKPGRKPAVKIASVLTEDDRRQNRLRTTLRHEWGHVHFHAYLWEVEPPPPDFLRQQPNRDKVICKRDSMLDAAQTDWMEWQAGYVCGVTSHHNPATGFRRNPASGLGADEHLVRAQGWMALAGAATERGFVGAFGAIFGAR